MTEEMPRLTKQRKNESENVECIICREVIRGDCFACGRCVCVCCSSCLFSWLDTSATCPMCRRKIEDDELARYPLSVERARIARVELEGTNTPFRRWAGRHGLLPTHTEEEEEEEASAHFPFVETTYNEEEERLETIAQPLICWNAHAFTFQILEPETRSAGAWIHSLTFRFDGIYYNVRLAAGYDTSQLLTINQLRRDKDLRYDIMRAFLRWVRYCQGIRRIREDVEGCDYVRREGFEMLDVIARELEDNDGRRWAYVQYSQMLNIHINDILQQEGLTENTRERERERRRLYKIYRVRVFKRHYKIDAHAHNPRNDDGEHITRTATSDIFRNNPIFEIYRCLFDDRLPDERTIGGMYFW